MEKRTLFFLSFAALFLQIVLIRWIPSQLQIVAFFTNLVLLGSFLGLGLGCLLTRLPFSLPTFLPSLMLLLVSSVALLSRWQITEVSNLGAGGSEPFVRMMIGGPFFFTVPLAGIFLLTAGVYVPLGQGIGRAFAGLAPLTAYTLNLFGGLAGLLTYGLLASLYTKPVLWFSLAGLAFLIAARMPLRRALLGGTVWGVCLVIVAQAQGSSLWSPYHKITTKPLVGMATGRPIGFDIYANQTGFTRVLDLSDQAVAEEPRLQGARACYDLPYRFVQPKRVLIVGAGGGNDVAAAIRAGAREIHAVEIDPLICILGEKGHPEFPYQHRAVRLTTADGRAFVEKATDRYDLILLGGIDSQLLFSQFSSVRLDNFIYTTDSFARLRDLLTPEGMLCILYPTTLDWLGSRIASMLSQTFGRPPVVFQGTHINPGHILVFLSGPAAKGAESASVKGFSPTSAYRLPVETATDDWPYLYIRRRELPHHYRTVIGILLGLSILLVLALLPKGVVADVPLFLMGAAFLLIETKAVTRTALLFGSTWTVNLWVICAVLLMAIGGTLLASRIRAPGFGRWFIALELAIALDWLIPPAALGKTFGLPLARVMASGVAALPLFFSGVIFALLLRRSRIPQAALGWNLLGAMAGGLLEYSSLVLGLRALSFLVALLYGLAFLACKLR